MPNPTQISKEGDLTEDEMACLNILLENSDTWGERCLGFDWFVGEEGLTRPRVQKAFKTLREKGFVVYLRGLMTDDGEVAGSGYHISSKGQDFICPCDECTNHAMFEWYEKDGEQTASSTIGAIRIRKCQEHHKESTKNKS